MEINFTIKSLVVTAVVFLNGTHHVHSQESIEEQIQRHLEKMPELRDQLLVLPGSSVSIPTATKKNSRFNFQKRMALSGHGVLYDVEGREVNLKIDEIFQLQEEMLSGVRQEKSKMSDDFRTQWQQEELTEIIKETESVIRKGLEPTEHFAALNLLTLMEASRLADVDRVQYHWRSNYLIDAVQRNYQVNFSHGVIYELSEWFRDWWNQWYGKTDYIEQCEAAGVPIPPNFSPNSSDWTHQGPLTTKLILSSRDANVWTWHESGQRGACVALPRGVGGNSDAAGIICQSATTGNACFWDNRRRGTGAIIPWAAETLIINQMQDGSELATNCTGCHEGNNVFLVSPEDPTWCRLLRGGQPSSACSAIDGTDISNFTLAVETEINSVNVPNTSIHHSRYTPISGSPPRAGWVNDASVGCGGVCHLGGNAVTPPPMPPACGVDCY